jgi:hypothetical protein
MLSIFARLGNHVFCSITGIPMCTNFAPLIAGLFLYGMNLSLWLHFKKTVIRTL